MLVSSWHANQGTELLGQQSQMNDKKDITDSTAGLSFINALKPVLLNTKILAKYLKL
jgi:hypothetical protein